MIELIIVEDNPLDVHLIKRVLDREVKKVGYLIFSDGEEASIYFENRLNQLPKLIILDIKLPKVEGFDLLKQLKQSPHTAAIPVIIFSSSNQSKDVSQAYKLGANGFLTKPSEYIDLKKLVLAINSYWLEHNKTVKHQ